MTAPIPPQGSVDETPSVVTAGITSLVQNADRLGLTWTLHLGTVDSYTEGGEIAFIVLDGDTAPIAAKSMIGTVVQTQRVYVIAIPPGGYFIVGFVGPSPVVPGGLQFFLSSSADTGSVGTGFVVVLSGGPFTFKAKRGYRLPISGGMSTSTITNAGEIVVNAIINGVERSLWYYKFWGEEHGTPNPQNTSAFGYTKNESASDVVATSILVYLRASAGTVIWRGSVNAAQPSVRSFGIEDYCVASLLANVYDVST